MAQDDFKINTTPSGLGVPASNAQLPTSLNNIDDNDPFSDVKKEMRTRFELLPEDIKAVILSSEYEMKLFNMAKTHKLTYEELGTLELETTMMLLGMTRAKEFRDELQIELKKNDGEIDALVNDLNTEIFSTIRQSLERVEKGQKDPEDYMDMPQEVAIEDSHIQATATPAVSLSSSTPAAPINFTSQNTAPQTAPLPQAPGMTEADHSEFAKQGIEIGTFGRSMDSTPPAIKAPVLNETEKIRTELLQKIENPTPTTIVSNPLTQSGPSIPPKTTDYSIPKVTSVPQPVKSSDPYREPIE